MGRSHGFWWSPDGSTIAFEQADNSPVTAYTIVHQGEDTVNNETHRYPFAGEANAAVRIGCVPAEGGDATWLPLEGVTGGDGYLARVNWAPDGTLLVQVISRDQRSLELRRIDPRARSSVMLITETSADWINLNDDLRCVPLNEDDEAGTNRHEILWSSEQSGTRQLYLCDADGHLLRQLTAGPWPVDRVLDVDAKQRVVYFLGSESPLESHVYRVGLDSGEPERLTHTAGIHNGVFSPDHTRWAESVNSLESPPVLTLRTAGGEPIWEIFRVADPEIERLALCPPELVTVPARDGATLYGAIYRPPSMAAGERYPVLLSVYGGPHVQTVTNSWGMTADLRAQFLGAGRVRRLQARQPRQCPARPPLRDAHLPQYGRHRGAGPGGWSPLSIYAARGRHVAGWDLRLELRRLHHSPLPGEGPRRVQSGRLRRSGD